MRSNSLRRWYRLKSYIPQLQIPKGARTIMLIFVKECLKVTGLQLNVGEGAVVDLTRVGSHEFDVVTLNTHSLV